MKMSMQDVAALSPEQIKALSPDALSALVLAAAKPDAPAAPRKKAAPKAAPKAEPDFEASEPEADDASEVYDGTAVIAKDGTVTLTFRPKSWKQGKRSKAVRGSGDRGEVVCRGLYNGRATGFFVRGFLANPAK